MEISDAAIAGITVPLVFLVALAVVFLFLVVRYRKWLQCSESDRQKFGPLDKLFLRIRKDEERNKKKREGSKQQTVDTLYIDIAKVSASYDNQAPSSDSYVVNTNGALAIDMNLTSPATLKVPSPPIRQSAENYTVIDLND